LDEIHYSEAGLIDKGSFGKVYFGKVRELPAAIKVLNRNSLSTTSMESFLTEVEIVKFVFCSFIHSYFVIDFI